MKEQNNGYSSVYIAKAGLLSAFAIIISYIESLIPINIMIPGIKLGLANIVIVMALYLLDNKSAIIINVIRILVIGMFFGNLFSILFSIAGAFLSFLVMVIVKKINGISIIGISVCGGVSHNVAQIIMAMFVIDTYGIMYYIPFLIAGGVVTGVLIGIVSRIVCDRVKDII